MGNIFHVAGLHGIINSLSNYPCLTVLFVATEVLESKKLTYFFLWAVIQNGMKNVFPMN